MSSSEHDAYTQALERKAQDCVAQLEAAGGVPVRDRDALVGAHVLVLDRVTRALAADTGTSPGAAVRLLSDDVLRAVSEQICADLHQR